MRHQLTGPRPADPFWMASMMRGGERQGVAISAQEGEVEDVALTLIHPDELTLTPGQVVYV